MHKTTLEQLAQDLGLAFAVSGIDPAKDTIASAVDKFRKLELRHLVLYIEDGGFLCLCSNAEMSKRLRDVIRKIDDELDADKEINIERSHA